MSNFLYTFISWRYLWRVKVGISTRPWGRRKEVANALGYTVGPYLPMVWAKPVEKAIHTVFAPLNTQTGWVPFGRIPDYSGSTEHFWILNIVTGIIATLAAYGSGASMNEIRVIALVVLIVPLPLDILLCVVIYWWLETKLVLFIGPIFLTGLAYAVAWLEFKALTFLQL